MAVFRSFEDGSAPSLYGNVAGSLIDLLKAVLVDGYGTQDSLGWEVAFEDTINNICVFRPINGTFRPYVRIDDNISSTGVQHAEVMCYESMTDVNTGFFPFPDLVTTPDHSLLKSFSNTSIAVPWYVIGDDRGFWFMSRPYDQTGDGSGTTGGDVFFAMAYIGEYTCNIITNTYNWMTMLNAPSTSYPNVSIRSTNVSLTKTSLCRDPDTMDSGSYNPDSILATKNSSTEYYGLGINHPNCSPKNGQYFYEPVIIECNDSWTTACVPGLFNMLWQSPTWEGTSSWYRQEPAELVPFFDGDMYVFPHLGNSATWNTSQTSIAHRAAILTGSNFRNAY